MSSDSELGRLERALAIFVDEFEIQGRDADEILAEHEDLADLLEPMLRGEPIETGLVEGSRFGDYRIVREIGRGGMGIVYEAQQISLDRRVALKLLMQERTSSANALLRFRREAAVIAQLDHENIVRVFATGSEDGRPFIAMELVDGVPLSTLIDAARESAHDRSAGLRAALAVDGSGPRGSYVTILVDVISQVADALSHAHRLGIIHRDIKPANIIVRGDGRAILTDFGIARAETHVGMTATGGMVGTPNYVAPEQVRGAETDSRTDVFALGVTLFESLTLSRPFDGDTPQALFDAILSREPRDPLRVCPELPVELAAIVSLAIEKEPSRRYQSMAAFAEDLRAFAEHRPVSARRRGLGLRLWRWAQRERAKATLAVVLVLAVPIVAALSGYLIANRSTYALGEEARVTQQVDQHLAHGYFQLHKGIVGRARSRFRRALELQSECVEAIAGLALTADRAKGAKAGVAILEGFDETVSRHAALQRLHSELAGATDGPQPTETASPFDAFVAGVLEIRRGHAGSQPAYERAVPLLHRAVLTSDRVRSYFYFEWAHAVGHSDSGMGQYDVRDALRRRWPNSWVASFWSYFAFQNGDRSASLEDAERAVRLNPTLGRLKQNLASSLHANGQNERALTILEELVGKAPEDPSIRYDLAVVYGALGRMDEFRAAAAKSYELGPDLPLAKMIHANVLVMDRDFDGALPLYAEVEASTLPAHQRAEAAARAGSLHRQKRQNDEAKAAYARALALRPEWPEVLTNVGNILLEESDLVGAERYHRQAVAASPGHLQANYNLVFLLRQVSRIEDAIEVAEAWTGASPGHWHAWFELASALYVDRTDLDRALSAVEKALAIAKRSALNPWIMKAQIQFQREDFASAVETMTVACELAPEGRRPALEAALERYRAALAR